MFVNVLIRLMSTGIYIDDLERRGDESPTAKVHIEIFPPSRVYESRRRVCELQKTTPQD